MTKNYEQPRLKVIMLNTLDIIMASGTDGVGGGGIYDPESPFGN